MKTTTWKPDTCGCVIEYEWDDLLSQEERVHTDKSIIKCDFHKSLIDVDAHNQVKKENQSKNIVHGHILENFPDLVDETTNENGQNIKKLKVGIKYDWSFDVDRNLVIDIVGADKKTKDNVLTSVKTKLNDTKIKLK